MAGLIAELGGFILGGLIWGYLFGRLAGRLFFKESEPDDKALKSAFIAFAFCYLLAGWGFASGVAINPIIGFYYAPGVILAYFLLRKDYRKRWVSDDEIFD